MISAQQWRVSIGLFGGGRGRKKENVFFFLHEDGPCTRQLKDLCARLFVWAIVLWIIYFDHYVTLMYIKSDTTFHEYLCTNFAPQQPYVNTLLLCGDVELNPGPPSIEEQLSLMHNNIMEKFDLLTSEVNKLSDEIKSVKTSLNNVVTSVGELTTEVHSLQDKVSTIEGKQETLSLDCIANTENLSVILERVIALETTFERQEQYSRRENVILHGVRESENETKDGMRKKVSDIFNSNVTSKHWREEDFLRAHRLGGSGPNKDRPIIIRFIHFFDKLKVMRAREELHKAGMKVADDLTIYQRNELKKLRDRGLRGYFRGGKLITHDPPSDYASAHPIGNAGTSAENRRVLRSQQSTGRPPN